jgi:hypothetical protein
MWKNKYDISWYLGWQDLLDELISRIAELINWWLWSKDFQITYIKEKYWGLRFEVNNSNEEISRLVTECELVSEWICWKCWKIWRIRYDRNWYMCLCSNCNLK